MISRRQAVALLPPAALAAVLASCERSGSVGSLASTRTATRTATTTTTTRAPTATTSASGARTSGTGTSGPTTPTTRSSTLPPHSDAADSAGPVKGLTADASWPPEATARITSRLAALEKRTGLTVGVCAHDAVGGGTYVHRADTSFETASVAKIDILAALLLIRQDAGRTLTTQQQALARVMVTHSDNAAAWELWEDAGRASGITRQNRRLGLHHTVPNPASWGLTATTARDQVALLSALAGDRGSPLKRDACRVALQLMSEVDGAQDWGVSAAADRGEATALKNGWLPRSTLGRRWLTNSVGRITRAGNTDLRLAVLTRGARTLEDGIEVVEEVARLVRSGLAS